jgi:dipeptidyl aminopeptidase/acylaminoacyl peptidase
MGKLTYNYRFYVSILALLIIQINSLVYSQKKPIDVEGVKNWPSVDGQKLSADGKYIMYNTGTRKQYSTIIKSTANSWKKEFPRGINGTFTDDSRFVIFKKSDSLSVFDLTKNTIQITNNVNSFRIGGEHQAWLAYHLNDTAKTLVIKDLNSDKTVQFSGVELYDFNDQGNILAVEIKNQIHNNIQFQSVGNIIRLSDLSSSVIYRGNDIANFIFDASGNQLVIASSDTKKKNLIYYYKLNEPGLNFVVSDSTEGMRNLILDDRKPFFSKSDNALYLFVRDTTGIINKTKINPISGVKIRKGDHNKELLDNGETPMTKYLAVVQLQRKPIEVRRLQFSGDMIIPRNISDTVMLLWRKTITNDIEFYALFSNGKRVLVTKQRSYEVSVSPGSNYILYYNDNKRSWFTYNIRKNNRTEITRSFPEPVFMVDDKNITPPREGILGWLPNDEYVCVYGRNDIWKVDPDGIRPLQNITDGYGKKNNIRLRYLYDNQKNIKSLDSLILMGYNFNTKEKGFFRLKKQLNNSYKVTQLTYGRTGYAFPGRQSSNQIGIAGLQFPMIPVKAKYADTYFLTINDAAHFPNLFVTNDFIRFDSITDVQPQKQYHWFQSEVIQWEIAKGKPGLGVIFKPEDFDAKKKYPVIFYFYEKSSDASNLFIKPGFSEGDIDIPWMVSRGYIIVAPDIQYEMGCPGKSSMATIVSAANYLITLPWVDAKHMGLQGHSFGGFETNYIISHSNLFAAAAPAAAVSNVVSSYNSPRGKFENELNDHAYFENSQGRMGGTLWQKKSQYINESPIFDADNVNTPILLMHNENDESVSFSQATEWFLALERLNKKIWFLIYDKEGHMLQNEFNQIDYTNKLTEFFDHYLKGAPMPEWMK